MSLEFSAAYKLMKSLAQKIGGKDDITKKDVEKIMKDADTNGDGIISEAEFKEVYMSTEDYEKLEEDYLEAFECLSEMDGEEGLSFEDFDFAIDKAEEEGLNEIEEEEEVEEEQEEESVDSAGSSGGGGGGGGGGVSGGGGSTSSATDKTPTTDSSANGNLDPVTLSEQNTMDELSSQRSNALNTLSEQREAKEAAIAEADAKVDTTQEAYNNATKNFADELRNKNKELSDQEESIVYLEDCQEALNTEITTQETKVSDCNTKVSECQSTVSDVESQISSLGSAPPETITVTDEDGNSTTVPNPAYAEWVAKKEALEAELAEAENELADAEVELADAESTLTNLESELSTIETALTSQINEYMQTEAAENAVLQGLQTEINESKTEYDQAKTDKSTIAQPYDTEIAKAQSDLRAYDRAIEIEEMPEDWSSEDKTGLEEVDKSNLPADYEVKSDGNIYDAEGNIVGKVVSASGDETTDEKSEDRYYLQKQEEPQSLSFGDKFDIAQNLARGQLTDDGEFDPEGTWNNYDFSNMSSSDIAKIAELYEAQIEKNQDKAVSDAVKGLPSSFTEAAEKYIKDEEGTGKQFNAIVKGLMKESEENEKAAEILKRDICAYLEKGDTSIVEAMIDSADSDYSAFMNFVDEFGLPAMIQKQFTGKTGTDELLGKLYEKVDQHTATDAESYGIDEERAKELESKYVSGDSNKNLKKVVDDINKGKLSDPDEINYLLAQFGSSSEIMKLASDLVNSGKLEAEDLNTIFKVSTTKQSEVMDAVNKDSELAKLFEEKNVDPMKSSQEEIDAVMKEYEKNQSSSQNKIPDEQVDKYLGGGLDKAFDDVKSDPEKLSDTVDKMMDKIINSRELSPDDKTRLLKEIKNYSEDTSNSMKEYFAKDDSFLVDTMKEMSKNTDKYSTQDKIDFLKQYVGLQESLAFFDDNSFFNSIVDNAYVEDMVELFEEASPEQFNDLIQYVNPSSLAKAIQSETSLGTETKLLQRLMTAVTDTNEYGKLSTDLEDYGITFVDVSKYDSIQDILDAYGKEDISQDVAKYLLAYISYGSPENLIDSFRDMSSSDQEEYIKQLYDCLTVPSKVSDTTAADEAEATDETETTEAKEATEAAETTKSNKPADTKEEFLASITDSQEKKFFEQIFEKYDYDSFWDRTDVPQYFQTLYADVPFSEGTIKSHGCGITSLAMVASYLKGEEITPDMLTNGYYGDNPASAMEAGFKNLGLDVQTYNGDAALNNLDAALESGTPIIARFSSSSLFTERGHFVVITGKTEDGKYTVNDPYIGNYYKNDTMVEGYTNGFTEEQIKRGLSGIYVFDN